ncbi:MAG: acyltransferase family protein [Eubacteriales bacterium]
MPQTTQETLSENSATTHLPYLDHLRLFATISVILLHATSKQWYIAPIHGFDWQILNIYDTLVRFCVPVFFMISGTLFLNPEKEFPLKKLFGKHLLHLGTAYLFWATFYIFLSAYRNKSPLSLGGFVSQLLSGHYHLWFLFALGGLYLSLPILRKIAQDKGTLTYFLGLSFVFVQIATTLQLSPSTGKWLEIWQTRGNFHLVLGYSGFFLLGHYLHCYPPKKTSLIHYLALVSLWGTAFGTHLLSQRDGGGNSALYHYLLPNTYLVAVSVFLFFQQKSFSPKLEQWIQKISPLTFGIYLIHDFYLVLFLVDWQWMSLGIPAIFSAPLFTLAVFLASTFSAMLLQKIPLLKKWIM